MWAGLRLKFQCRSCGHQTPLDQPPEHGSARCLWCDTDQAFPPEIWKELLQKFHAVTDLGGPAPEGQNPHARLSIRNSNPWSDIGEGRHTADLEEDFPNGVAPLRVWAEVSRGFPCCPLGHGAMRVEARSGELELRCARCSEGGVYAAPDRQYRALTAVVTDAARVGVKQARTVTTNGLVAFNCPGCGAPLPVAGRGFAACSFCHLTSALPATRQRPAPGSIQPALWWVSFRGGSPERARLEKSPPTSLKIDPPPAGTGSTLRKSLLTVPVLVLPSGALLVTGAALFLLVRAGLLPGF